MRRLTLYFVMSFTISILYPISVQAVDIYHIAQDKHKAVFFIYHHIGEDQYPSSNLQVEYFSAHLQELKTAEYNVMPVPDIIAALKSGTPLPQHTIGITLEGAYKSTFENAIPLLLKAKLPFTLFIAPERIDRQADYYMSWQNIKQLVKNDLVSIGALPFSYTHIAMIPKNIQQKQWGRSIARFKEVIGYSPKVFSWPYGEYTSAMKTTIRDYNFAAGFAQHSGVAFNGSDMLSIPRFSMTDQYGDLDRFRLAAHSFPFPTTQDMPKEMVLTGKRPQISFNISKDLVTKNDPSCFISNVGKVSLARQKTTHINITLNEDISEKRIRLNCTLPVLSAEEAKQGEQYWRWYGRLFILPEDKNIEDEYTNTPE